MRIIDANLILRYILNDNRELADKAAAYIAEGNIIVYPEVIAEVVYVLSGKIYNVGRKTIKTAISVFLNEINCNNEIIKTGIDIFAENSKLDFIDCLLYAYNKVYEHVVLTLDKDLIKALNV